MSSDHTRLDVEDDDQRQRRIGTLLERLNTTSPSSSVVPNSLLNIGHERVPGPTEPPVELLSRVRAFLPTISASNEALSQQKPEDIDIENVPEDAEQYIEMNLGLGVLEAKSRRESGSRSLTPSSDGDSISDGTSESDSESSRDSSEEDSDSASSSSDDDSDLESQEASSVEMRSILSRPIKPLPRAKLEV